MGVGFSLRREGRAVPNDSPGISGKPAALVKMITWEMPNGFGRLVHAKRAARSWIGTARQFDHSNRLRADGGHVLGRRAFLTLNDVELHFLTFA